MKKIVYVLIMILVLCGCDENVYKAEKQNITSLLVPENSYVLSGVELEEIEKSEYETSKRVYYVESEEELAKVIQYTIENGDNEVSYQCKDKIDLDKTALLLTFFNPYDLSLHLSTTDYTDGSNTLIYRSNTVEIENLDERYTQGVAVSKQIIKKITTKEMDNEQKIVAIHDYLVKHVMYHVTAVDNPDDYPNVFKGAGALLDKVAVCTGYSRAFMVLARLADVPAMYVASDTMNHGWNLVYGNTGWRYIDVTWDDPVPETPNTLETKFRDLDVDEFLAEGTHIFDEDKNSDYYIELASTFFNKK